MDMNSRMYTGAKTGMRKNNVGEYESTFGNETMMKSQSMNPKFRSKNLQGKGRNPKKLTATQEKFGDSAHDFIEEERKSLAESSEPNKIRGYESDEGVLDQMPNFNRNAFGN